MTPNRVKIAQFNIFEYILWLFVKKKDVLCSESWPLFIHLKLPITYTGGAEFLEESRTFIPYGSLAWSLSKKYFILALAVKWWWNLAPIHSWRLNIGSKAVFGFKFELEFWKLLWQRRMWCSSLEYYFHHVDFMAILKVKLKFKSKHYVLNKSVLLHCS